MAGQPEEFARFVSAHARAYERAFAELSAGRMDSHWMWFIFPQLRGLGHSEMSRRYAIVTLKQAKKYLEHDLLGAHLRACTALACDAKSRAIDDVFGGVNSMKFHSCVTLFSLCNPHESVFQRALAIFFEGKCDQKTIRLLHERHEIPDAVCCELLNKSCYST